MKKFYLAALAALTLAPSALAGRWVPVTDPAVLEYVDEVAIVYYNAGKFVNNGMPQKRTAPMIKNGTEGCVAMANSFVGHAEYAGQVWSEYRESNDVAEYQIIDGLLVIPQMPEGTALLNVKKETDGYTLYNSNNAKPGYLAPAEADVNRKVLQLSQTPWYHKLKIAADGAFTLTALGRDGYDIFSLWDYGTYTSMLRYATFVYCEAGLDYGHNYFMVDEDKLPLAYRLPATNPTNGFESTPTVNGTKTITFNWDGCNGALNSQVAATITGSFTYLDSDNIQEVINLDASNIKCSESLPASIEVTLPNGIEGSLVLNLPEGLYNLSKEGFDPAPSHAYKYTLELKKPAANAADAKYSFSPQDGYVVGELTDILLEFSNCVATVSEDVDDTVGYTATLNGEEIMTPLMKSASEYVYREPLTEPGTYVLTFDAGFFDLTFPNGAVVSSNKIVFTITIADLLQSQGEGWSVSPEPMQNLEMIKSFTFDFDDAEEIVVSTGVVDENFRIIHNGNTITYNNGIYEQEFSPWIMTLTEGIYAETSPGLVAVVADEGFWTCTNSDGDDFPSPALSFVVNLGDPNQPWGDLVGVNRVDAVDGTFTVFNLQGVCIMRNVDAATVTTLPAGFYIINGKKFIVR